MNDICHDCVFRRLQFQLNPWGIESIRKLLLRLICNSCLVVDNANIDAGRYVLRTMKIR